MWSKKNIYLIVTLLYILYTIFPLLADMINIPVWLPSIAVSLALFILYPQAYANKIFYWFLVYAFVLFVYLIVGRPLTIGIGTVQDSRKILIEFSNILPAISIVSVFFHLKDEKVTRQLVMWSMIFLFVSFIVAIPLMRQYNSIREALEEENYGAFSIPGLPGYSLMHAYALVLPVLCYATKVFSGWKKILFIVALAVVCFVVYDTFVTTSLLIMLGVVMFTIIFPKKNPRRLWITAALTLVIVLFMYETGLFIRIIDWMMPAFDGTAAETKLWGIRQSLLQGQLTGGDIEARQEYHRISWNSFLNNFLFGSSVVGNHSTLLDRFGGMGVVAGIPFIMIFISFIKRMGKLYETKIARAFFWAGIIAGAIFLYQKGLWGCESWLMYLVLMPMGILVLERIAIRDESKAS